MKTGNALIFILILLSLALSGQNEDLQIKNPKLTCKSLCHTIERGNIQGLQNHLPFELTYKKNTTRFKSANTLKQQLDSILIENSSKFEYTYDTYGNNTVIQFNSWENNHWSPTEKFEYSYNDKVILTQEIQYSWDSTVCVPHLKYEYTYDEQDNIIKTLIYLWTDNQWAINTKTESNYDTSGNYSGYVRSDWKEDQWIFSGKGEYTIDSKGNPTMYINYSWGNNQWEFISKMDYTYDDKNNNLGELYYMWRNNKWEPSIKLEFLYDANGNNTQEIDYYWENGEWVNWAKYEKKFDLTCTNSSLVLPQFYFNGANWEEYNKVVEFSGLTWDGSNNWIVYETMHFYYSEQNILTISNQGIEISQVYPNPATKYLSFTIAGNNHSTTFELFDIQGNRIMVKEINRNERLSLEGLKAGLYYYNLISDSKKQSGKIVKR